MKKSLLEMSMETIDFQDGTLGKKLELIIDEIKEKNDSLSDLNKSNELKKLNSTIFDEMGMLVKIEFQKGVVGAIITPEINLSHIFKNNKEGADVKSMVRLASQHKETSIVDIKNSKIKGLFSKIEVPIFLGYKEVLINTDLATRHIVAVLLHEIGHLFTLFEYSNRVITTNQCLAFVSKSLMDKNNIKEHEYAIRTSSELITGDKNSLSSYEEEKDDRVLVTLFIDRSIDAGKSELGVSSYDYNSSEYLADQFATRHGYGRELIQLYDLLDKSRYSRESNRHSLTWIRLLDMTSFVVFSTLAMVSLNPVIASLVVSFYTYKITDSNSYTGKDYTYDNLQTKMKRIREQLIQYLRQIDTGDLNLTQSVLKTLDETKRIIDSTRVYEGFMTKIVLFISKKNRTIKESLLLQRDLEELASNELFVKAAKLSTLSK